MTPALLAAAIVLTPALPATESAPMAGAALAAGVETASYDDESEPGLLERMWPLWLDDDLDPLVERGVWTFWIGGFIPVVPFGNIWLPLVLIDAPIDSPGYLLDALLIEVVHVLPHLLLFPVAFAVIFGGSFAGIALGQEAALPIALGSFIGGFGLMAANGVCLAANLLWCLPVATANAFDRAVDRERASYRRSDTGMAPAARGELAMAY